ncbi:MAG: hypothetical protein WDW36_009312 [Sanguina aurantia]
MSVNGASHISSVAVVGAGVSGSVCAQTLSKAGVNVTVFDQGWTAPGGRTSSRQAAGCQFFRHTPGMQPLIDEWLAAGVAAEWACRRGTLDIRSGSYTQPDALSSTAGSHGGFFDMLSPGPLYVGVPSMAAIPASLCSSTTGSSSSSSTNTTRASGSGSGGATMNLVLGSKVTSASQDADGRWVLSYTSGSARDAAAGGSGVTSNRSLPFDALVFSDSLFARPGGASHIETPGHSTASSPIHALRESLASARRVALFSLMFALPSPGLSLPFEAASLTSPDASHGIAFLCEDSSKPGRERDDGLRSYVAVTTEAFAADLMDPGSGSAAAIAAAAAGALPVQSSSYRGDKAALIWARLLEDLKSTAGASVPPTPVYMHAQRWGAAYTDKPLGVSHMADAHNRFAACGDFCLGAGFGNAALSGEAAAIAVVRMLTPSAEPML